MDITTALILAVIATIILWAISGRINQLDDRITKLEKDAKGEAGLKPPRSG